MAIFCLTLETRRKRHLSLILHRAPNLPSPLICLVKRLIIQNCKLYYLFKFALGQK